MNHASRLHRGVLLILVAGTVNAGSLVAVQRVERPKLAPEAAFTGEPTTVLITSQVAVDPLLIPSGTRLIERVGTAQAIVLGVIYDDGTHGDALAGDQTFSALLGVNQTNREQIQLATTVAYRGVVRRAQSPSVGLSVLRRPSNDQLQAEIAVQSAAANLFATLRNQVGDDAARATLVAQLKTTPEVVDAGIASDEQSLWIKYGSGIEGGIEANPLGTRGTASKPLPAGYSASSRPPSFVTRMEAPEAAVASPVATIGNGRGLVLAPQATEFSPADESGQVEAALKTICGSSVTVYRDASADVAKYKTMNLYGAIHIESHGSEDSGGNVCLTTGEPYSFLGDLSHLVDLLLGRLNYGSANYRITPSFVTAYAGGGYPQTMVFANACLTFGEYGTNLTMAKAFLGSGATTYYGWERSVGSGFAVSTANGIYNSLTDFTREPGDRTTGKAFDALPSRVGGGAEFLMAGSRDLALLGNPIVNGGFESGDLSGWTTGFDPDGQFPEYSGPYGPYVRAVSEDRSQGTYAVRIGRWDEPYMGGGLLDGPPQPGVEPAETDWIYQDVPVPAGVSTYMLKFSLNFVTYDAVVWDWFYARILDPTSGAQLDTVVNDLGQPGTHYGLYYTSGWQDVSYNLAPWAGRTVRLWFGNHQDGFGDQAATYVDNVRIDCR